MIPGLYGAAPSEVLPPMCQVERSRRPSGSRSACASQESENDWEFVGAGMSSSDGPNGVLGVELARDELTRCDHHRVQSHDGREEECRLQCDESLGPLEPLHKAEKSDGTAET